MTAVEISLRLDEASQARADALLAELAARASNPGGGLKIVGQALLREQNRRFQTESDPDGRPWAPLAPLTRLLRGGVSGPILRRSGHLMASGSWQVSGMTLSVGVSGVQAGVMQYGATIRPVTARHLAIPVRAGMAGRNRDGYIRTMQVTIPPRPMVGFGPRDEEATRNAIADWLAVDGVER